MNRYIIFFLLLLPFSYAYEVNISISSNDIVTEQFRADIPQGFDYYEFSLPYEPVSVIYSGRYEIADDALRLYSDGKDDLEFSLIYADMIEKSGQTKVFRTEFDSADTITLTLPEKHILAKEPGTVPQYSALSSDGEHIIITWDEADAIAVFYEGPRYYFAVVTAACIGLLALTWFFLARHSRKKVDNKVKELISDEEFKVVSLLKKGHLRQNEIAKALGFSKSKMSKIIRKLEEKRLVAKSPHYKTNIIKLKN